MNKLQQKGVNDLYNYNKLRGRITEKFRTQEKFAAALGVTVQCVNTKLNGTKNFNQTTIDKWCEVLEIPAEKIGVYFFTKNVQ